MAKETDTYDYIAEKINLMKDNYPALRNKPDYYVFSALFIKTSFYKNPERVLSGNDIVKMIVDGPNDFGIDILLPDPNSQGNDLIIGQAKYRNTTSYAEILSAVEKMANGYKDLLKGHYELADEQLVSTFVDLHDNIDEESKICFVFYTSAPRKRINTERVKKIEKIFREKFIDTEIEQFINTDNIEFQILFDTDIKKEIKDAASWKSTIESGKICIDEADNYLTYGDDAIIVNVSAFSIRKLYKQHEKNLLALNLRYHIKERKRDGVDNAIKNTIENNPESFWLKNNGITIICDKFCPSGKEVHLENFSIVNGGQTTYMLSKSDKINTTHDFYLPCKIIKNIGETKKEKTDFSLEIAQAANAQKPITQEDLKVNSPEQISFAREMRAVGIFYQTKRGEEVDKKQYSDAYRKTKMDEIGKLCLASIFQMPCVSRNGKSGKKMFHESKYYDYIFAKKQSQVAKICKELLYINYYFKNVFKRKFERDNKNEEDPNTRINFANKARTICIAFTALAARYHQGNITDQDIKTIQAIASTQPNSAVDDMYKAVRDIGSMQFLFPKQLSENMNLYDAALDKLFTSIIEEGIFVFSFARDNKPDLNANSFLQNDKNYYTILKRCWSRLKPKINEAFANV